MKTKTDEFHLDIHRKKLDVADRRALSKDAIDELEDWCNNFVLLVRESLLDAVQSGITMPRRIQIKGTIEVSDE